MIEKPSFRSAFLFWLKLGFISFGGPAGQIAIMHKFLVEEKKWISDSRFLHALNYTMILPGPEAQQLATYTGWLLHGTAGGLAAGVLFVLPSMAILLSLSILYATYGSIPAIYSLFEGLKPAVIAIVILALVKIGSKSLRSTFHYFVAASAFVAIFFFNIPFPFIIILSLIIAVIARRFFPEFFAEDEADKSRKSDTESNYYVNSNSELQGAGIRISRVIYKILLAFLLWLVPIGILYLTTSNFDFWKQLSLFFTQAAFVTFGGAYAVLPYVAQVSVQKLHWLSELQMIDGLALGETTPGPLVMVLTFVGFMAGYNHFGASILMGSLGLLTSTFFTFLPCFLFIFAGAPIIEATRNNLKLKAVLSIVTAAVVGVVLNLTIYLAKAILFPDEISISGFDPLMLGWVLVSVFALRKFKIGMIPWIGVSSLFGLILYLVR